VSKEQIDTMSLFEGMISEYIIDSHPSWSVRSEHHCIIFIEPNGDRKSRQYLMVFPEDGYIVYKLNNKSDFTKCLYTELTILQCIKEIIAMIDNDNILGD
jgi:hypothetical protein